MGYIAILGVLSGNKFATPEGGSGSIHYMVIQSLIRVPPMKIRDWHDHYRHG